MSERIASADLEAALACADEFANLDADSDAAAARLHVLRDTIDRLVGYHVFRGRYLLVWPVEVCDRAQLGEHHRRRQRATDDLAVFKQRERK